jgi:hypothetical protein
MEQVAEVERLRQRGRSRLCRRSSSDTFVRKRSNFSFARNPHRPGPQRVLRPRPPTNLAGFCPKSSNSTLGRDGLQSAVPSRASRPASEKIGSRLRWLLAGGLATF